MDRDDEDVSKDEEEISHWDGNQAGDEQTPFLEHLGEGVAPKENGEEDDRQDHPEEARTEPMRHDLAQGRRDGLSEGGPPEGTNVRGHVHWE
jgi:hypothetical protein